MVNLVQLKTISFKCLLALINILSVSSSGFRGGGDFLWDRFLLVTNIGSWVTVLLGLIRLGLYIRSVEAP